MIQKKIDSTRNIAIFLFFFLAAALVVITVSQARRDNWFGQTKNITPTPTADTATIKLPFPITHPNLGMVFLVYNFFGPIKEIKDAAEGVQLILDIPDDNLPKFILDTKATQIFKASGGQPTAATVSDLKPNTSVTVQALYDLKLNIWRVIRVDIF